MCFYSFLIRVHLQELCRFVENVKHNYSAISRVLLGIDQMKRNFRFSFVANVLFTRDVSS